MICTLVAILTCVIVTCNAKVLVIGGTGRVGSAVVRHLDAAGIPANILSRTTNDNKEKEGIDRFVGDAGSMNDLIEASKGCNAIIAVHGVTPPRFSKLTDFLFAPHKDRNHPYNVNYIGMKKIVAAMKTNNVTKFVRITGSYVDKSPFLPFVAIFNFLLSRTVKWHQMGEKVIREAGIDYTVIRPPGIRQNLTVAEPRQLVLLPGDSHRIKKSPGQISVEDLASLCVLAVGDQRLSNATVICNTETAPVAPGKGEGATTTGLPHDGGESTWEHVLSGRPNWRDVKTIVPGRHNLAVAMYAVLVPVVVKVIGRVLTAASKSVWSVLSRRYLK